MKTYVVLNIRRSRILLTYFFCSFARVCSNQNCCHIKEIFNLSIIKIYLIWAPRVAYRIKNKTNKNQNRRSQCKTCYSLSFSLLPCSESDGNPSTEDESSKGQEDLSPHPLASTSDGGTSLSLPSPMEPVYMQQLGGTKISLSSSGVLLNGNLVPTSPSPVFLNGASFIQGPNGVILNGLNVGASQAVSLNPPKTSPSPLSNGVSMTNMLASSSEDVKDFKILQTSMSDSATPQVSTATTYSPSPGPGPYPGLIPSMEVKREESEEAIGSQDSNSVVTFTTPVQINQYGVVQIPSSTTNSQLLNGGMGFPVQLPPVSVATSQGKNLLFAT